MGLLARSCGLPGSAHTHWSRRDYMDSSSNGSVSSFFRGLFHVIRTPWRAIRGTKRGGSPVWRGVRAALRLFAPPGRELPPTFAWPRATRCTRVLCARRLTLDASCQLRCCLVETTEWLRVGVGVWGRGSTHPAGIRLLPTGVPRSSRSRRGRNARCGRSICSRWLVHRRQ